MNKVLITQIAIVTAMGNTLEETWRNMLEGKGAVSPVNRFPTHKLNGSQAACIPYLDETDDNKTICLLKKLIPQLDPLPKNTFLIWTGIKGGVEDIERKAEGKPLSGFQYPRDYRKYLNCQLGLQSEGMDVNAACASSTVGICIGANMIERGDAESVLVIGADWVSRFTFSGFSALNALTRTTCRSFDKNRDGLALGDGAAAVHLVSGQYQRKKGLKSLAQLRGWGISNDAHHITRPNPDGSGLSAAIKSALKRADLSPEDVCAFCAHGTGTVYNDSMELAALVDVFGERKFPLFSVKAALGHTLGPAGAIETAISIQVLKARKVPPTHNLILPEDIARQRVANTVQSINGETVLTSNSGFGGINAALIMENMP
jgi:3-oxoacyl-(acyl-carrier-protein) synthase